MKQLKLLIIDDDLAQVQLILDRIKEKNVELRKRELEIIPENLKSGEEAIFKVTSNDYNAAIVDLKLSDDKTKTDGNDIIKEIKTKMRFPVFVLSNFPQDLEPDFDKETDVFKIRERSNTDLGAMIDEIVNLYISGISELFGENGKLEKYITESLSELFWGRIAITWSYLIERIPDPEIRVKIISRQLNTILKEKMGQAEFGFEKSEPFEVYMIPSLKKHTYTGDILQKEDIYYVVLTPACDIVSRVENKPDIEYILLSELTELKKHSYIKNCWKDGQLILSSDNKKVLQRIISNKKANIIFFLLLISQWDL